LELGTLPKIYPITDTRLTSLSHAEQVEKLSDGGTRFIQLREKYASPRDFYEDAKSAIEIARRNGVKIIINDRVDIALALKADGVHLGQDDLPPAKARAILGEKAIIGFSTHSLEQAIEAARLPVDYIAIGPVFSTQTKENPDETVGLEGVKTVREAIGDFPLVAIGGITPENFQAVFEAGADSLAIIKAVLFPPHKIEENLHSFLSTLP
jgi:thiamine-phosphate pyrophosphorylase